MARRRAIAAIDLGGTTTKIAILAAEGSLSVRRICTPRGQANAVVAHLRSTLEDLTRQAAADDLELCAAHVAIPGVVDEERGLAVQSVNIGWRNLALRDALHGVVPCPLAIGHDVRLGAVAESVIGAGKRYRSSLFVPIGTGIAAAHVVGGVAAPGATFRAGEIGQMATTTTDDGRSVPVEAVASARSIAARYCRLTGEDPTAIDASDVVQRLEFDAAAASVWTDATGALAEVLASAIASTDPACIIVGGGLSRSGPALIEPLRAGLRDRLTWRPEIPVVTARFVDDAGIVGAAMAAWSAAGEDGAAVLAAATS